jgi:uncharacterized membrane protein YhaH (DUF805 family)
MSLLKACFSFKGRMGRTDFWVISQSMVALGGYLANLDSNLAWLALVPFASTLAVSTKRLRDRNRKPLLLLLMAIPFANLWLFVELFFLGGVRAPEHSGQPPARIRDQPVKRAA